MVDEAVPGVTFYLDAAKTLPPGNPKMLARARVELSAEIYDNDVWEAVIEKLSNDGKGMRIHTVASFAEELVDVMKGRMTQAEKKYQQELAEKDEHIARIEQQLSFAQADARMAAEGRDLAQKRLQEYEEEARQEGMDRDLCT